MRKDKANYYLDIADAVRSRSTCLRRQYGAIIVASDEIIATGYNGAPRGRKNCDELGRCTRQELQIPSGERYELCRAVHAEENAIISAARKEMLGSTLYLVGRDAQTGGLLDSATPLHPLSEEHHQRGHPQRGLPCFRNGIYGYAGDRLDRGGRHALKSRSFLLHPAEKSSKL